MTDGAQREQLSALLDDEASDLEVRRVLRDMNAADLVTWGRWQLARDLMNGQRPGRVPDGFAAGVAAQLDSRQDSPSGWMARMGRMAVAASVAAATVVGWQYYSGPESVGGTPTVAASQESRLNAPVGETSLVSGGVASGDKAATQDSRHLDGMVLRHNDLSARHSGQGVTPYARLISMQARHGSR